MQDHVYSIRVYENGEQAVIQCSVWRKRHAGAPLRRWRLVSTAMPAHRAEDPRTVLRAVLERLIEP